MNQSATSRATEVRSRAFLAPIPSLAPCAILFLRSTRKLTSRLRRWSSASKSPCSSAAQSPSNRRVRSMRRSGDGLAPRPSQLVPNDAILGGDLLEIKAMQHWSTTCSRYPHARTTRKRDRAWLISSGWLDGGCSTRCAKSPRAFSRFVMRKDGHDPVHKAISRRNERSRFPAEYERSPHWPSLGLLQPEPQSRYVSNRRPSRPPR